MGDPPTPPTDAFLVASRVGAALNDAGLEYAIGGALALGYWSEPRGTNNVDVTVFMNPDAPDECFETFVGAGGNFRESDAVLSIREHGFFHMQIDGIRVDVFLPTIPVYEECRNKRHRVDMGGVPVDIWGPEAIAIFKMMFFRPRDLLDVEAMLLEQGEAVDHSWVRERLIDTFGRRDPRIARWDEIVALITC